MTTLAQISFEPQNLETLTNAEGKIAVLVDPEGKLDQAGRRLNRLTRGSVERFAASEVFEKLSQGEARELAFPAGLAASGLVIVKLSKQASRCDARKAGAALARAQEGSDIVVYAGSMKFAHYIAQGLALRAYKYQDHKTAEPTLPGAATFLVKQPEEMAQKAQPLLAVAEGVCFTRDLTSAPANHLTTEAFAKELTDLKDLGVKVEVLEEVDLEELGMGSLLCVGQGSDSPSKVVVMQWKGPGAKGAPFALVGKGVVFDTGGISLKPASGMEEMTMDMGGAGVVSGVMKGLALRKSPSHVVGLVGLVENMPSGNATRPGDVVTSMKGDTIEVINTDAEGRLVLADVLWYAQERFKPCSMIDLATLTGAIIVGLGHDKAGVFSNDDDLCKKFLSACDAENEGAWRMPLAASYDKQLKSSIADMKNIGSRAAGSITAAQFLQRFVKPDVPWCHLDIAGVASVKSETEVAPKGATGWGVRALDRLISDHFEG